MINIQNVIEELWDVVNCLNMKESESENDEI